uniref:Uncharacterized protein n=1 Tax=viral metagenome TaxID=1070528 RepID=A0A6C0HWQ6_9ZZZZ
MGKSRKQQKVWKMKGCSSRKYLGGARRAKVGGQCSMCSLTGGKRRSRSRSRRISRNRNRRGGGCGCSAKLIGGGRMAGMSVPPAMGGGGGIVNPFVGDAWAANVGRWPGVQGIAGVTNHFSPYDVTKDPNLQSISERDGGIFPQPVWTGRGGDIYPPLNPPKAIMGGRREGSETTGGKRMSKRMSKRMRKTGGGIIPQDLINGGRNIMYGLGSTYNAMAGYPAPVNPLPYKDQLMGK